MRRIVLATGNKGKLAEIRQILRGHDITVEPQSNFDFVPAEETGDTFLANAMLKARQAADKTGLIAIADDSGLSVDALNGAPGVRSARFAGDAASDNENVDKLLLDLQQQPESQRAASFHCVAVVVFPEPQVEPLIAKGEWRGSIALTRRGKSGFGYDPVFFDPESGKCAAELTPAEKNQRSHRGQAFQRLGALLIAALHSSTNQDR